MKLGVDIDGVLADIIDEVLRRANREFNLSLGRADVSHFHLSEILEQHGVKTNWLYKTFKDEWFWASALPISPNIDTLRKWYKEGHWIHLITSRSPEVSMPTVAWLRRNNVPFHHLEFSSALRKHEHMQKANLEVLFDDLFYEVNKVASFGFVGYVVRAPYNVLFESRVTNPSVRFIDTLADADGFVNSV